MISKGSDRSYVVSAGEDFIVLGSQGLTRVYLYPNLATTTNNIVLNNNGDVATFDVFYTAGSTGFEIQFIDLEYVCDSSGDLICDSDGNILNSGTEVLNTSDFFNINIGPEQSVTPSRVRRTITVTQTAIVTDGIDDKRLRINFDNYMAQADITITQTPPPALTLASMTGGGVTGTATSDNTSSSTRNQIMPSSSSGTSVLTVSGEEGATYQLGENGNIFNVGSKTTVYTIPSGGSNTHNITIAPAANSEQNGAVFATNTITNVTEQIYFVQPADNVPVLALEGQTLTDPISGEFVSGTINITAADPGDGTLVIQRPNGATNSTQTITIASDETGSATWHIGTSLAGLSGTWTFTFTDAGGLVGVTTLNLTVTYPSFNGSVIFDDWNEASGTTSWTISGLSTAQRGRLEASDLSVVQSSPTTPSRGTIGAVSYVSSTGTFTAPISSRPPYTSLSGTEVTIWAATLAVGSGHTYSGNDIVTKSARPENSLTFPNGNPTILSYRH